MVKKKSKHSPKRSALQREMDLKRFAEMGRTGASQRDCMAWIKANRPYRLSQSQISYDAKTLMERWREEARLEIGSRIAKQMASIDAQEAEAWRAWHASIGLVIERTEEFDKTVLTKAMLRKNVSHGDTRYLAVIANCVEARNRLLGLHKQKIELSGPEGGPVEMAVDGGEFDIEHLNKLLADHYKQANEAETQ